MRLVLLILGLLNLHGLAIAQTNVVLLHQLVDQSKSENTRQKEARDKQALASANEEVNRGQMAKLKSKYRELQSRFKVLGLAIDAAQIGIQAAPIISEIVDRQQQIISLASDDPLLIALALDVEADLVGQAHLLGNYLYGLAISIGDLNQMKSSDRKMLFGHVLVELRRIAGTSRGLAQSLQYASGKKKLDSLNPFAAFVQQDKQLVEEIMRRIDILKQP
ncbi:hypothetical protein DU508_21665 [Pedobacter chinensis]|uniref:Plasmid transfer protein n=1 Tax=Pedobacter chinensis TaxID=2282421 RepID=A0A369PPW2_9SPHI|nr:hypothetical protein [Pedobacter chinensis]RDC54332.1 hypothetical protein DU508_21665 [Pedobacter chinensis]